jgi:metallophosphoesterase superfamily enzyme
MIGIKDLVALGDIVDDYAPEYRQYRMLIRLAIVGVRALNDGIITKGNHNKLMLDMDLERFQVGVTTALELPFGGRVEYEGRKYMKMDKAGGLTFVDLENGQEVVFNPIKLDEIIILNPGEE